MNETKLLTVNHFCEFVLVLFPEFVVLTPQCSYAKITGLVAVANGNLMQPKFCDAMSTCENLTNACEQQTCVPGFH